LCHRRIAPQSGVLSRLEAVLRIVASTALRLLDLQRA
jgi:hypothetical protein